MPVKNIAKAITLTSFDSASLTGTYQPINSSGLDFPCFYVRINNTSNVVVTISYDGVNDHDVILASDKLDLNLQTNAGSATNVCNFAKGKVIYIKGTAGTGLVYVSGYYQPTGV